MRRDPDTEWLIFRTLFIGIGTVAGGLGMITDPSGKALYMDAMLPFFQKLPFADVCSSERHEAIPFTELHGSMIKDAGATFFGRSAANRSQFVFGLFRKR